MDLQISVFLLFSLFTRGHSVDCYDCASDTGFCNQEVSCPQYTNCFSASFPVNRGTILVKGCALAGCPNGSINLGAGRFDPMCCNTNLCNDQTPDLSTNTLNGKMCYYCNEESCSKLLKLNCSGSEDRCITATATLRGQPLVVKGCASKSICDAPFFIPGVNSTSCCEGNLCNCADCVPRITPRAPPRVLPVLIASFRACCSSAVLCSPSSCCTEPSSSDTLY